MARLSNTPRQTLNFELERRKSYTFQCYLLNGDKSPVVLEDCTLRFVVKEFEYDDDQFDMSNLIFNAKADIDAPLEGYGVFSFQAAELDWNPGEYNYAIVLWTPEGYSTVIVKGVLTLLPNTESNSMHQQYSSGTAGAILELSMRSGDVVNIVTNSMTQGSPGRKGDQGDAGTAATVDVGEVQTGAPGSEVQVWNSGDAVNAELNFTIPRGDKGEQGDIGDTGPAATVEVGTTTALDPADPPTVTNSGDEHHAVFDFGIPQGVKGDKGDRGDVGPAGLTWRGIWLGSVDYAKDDAVQYASSSWVASADPPAGSVPSDASPYWQQLALQGAKGDKGDKGDKGNKGDKGDTGATGLTSLPVGTVQMWAGEDYAIPTDWLLCNGDSFDPAAYPELYDVIGTTYGTNGLGYPCVPDIRDRFVLGTGPVDPFIGNTGGLRTVALTLSQIASHVHTMNHTHSIDPPSTATSTEPAHTHTMAHSHTIDPPATATNTVADHTHGPGTLSGYYRMRQDDDSGTGAYGSVEYAYSAYNSNRGAVVINAGATAGAGSHAHTVDIGAFSSGGSSAANTGSDGDHSHTVDIAAFNSAGASTANTGSNGGGAAHENMPPFIVLNYIIKAA